jgi:hypothetical protein
MNLLISTQTIVHTYLPSFFIQYKRCTSDLHLASRLGQNSSSGGGVFVNKPVHYGSCQPCSPGVNTKTATVLHIAPFHATIRILGSAYRFVTLLIVYFVLFATGGQIVGRYLPPVTPEPGPVSTMIGFWISCVAITLVFMLMIHSSRWHGWKLMIYMSVAYLSGCDSGHAA